MSKIKFNNSEPAFFNDLKKRVDNYFNENNLKASGNFKLYAKTIILLTTLVAGYIWMVFFTPESNLLSIFICMLIGVNVAAIGFNVMHDGAHGSYSSRKWVNTFMGFSLNILGGNVYIWSQKHNINHHSYTNVEGMDDDIDIKPYIRVHPDQEKKWYHQFQHYYGLFLYGTTYLFWVFFNDFNKYFSGKIAEHTKMRKMDLPEHFNFWISKVLYVFFFIVLPFFFVGIISTIVGYLILAASAGIVIAIVFQLAHIVEDAHFVVPEGSDTKIQTEWAKHQINTTVNFATRSRSMSWLLGGLNFQVEHHLFPKISHVHYPAINKIVKETCKEYGVNYREFPTVLSAIKSHLLHLKQVGQAA
ncbi:MAG: fatty acid desaturase family protein [Bacteroidia bacterium]|jgi:linoleoyl-CoA desaturase